MECTPLSLSDLAWPAVLCRSCLQQPGETVRSQVLESLGCWLKLSGGSHLPPGVPESPLVAAALDGLKVDGTFHAAVDAVSRAPSRGRVVCASCTGQTGRQQTYVWTFG